MPRPKIKTKIRLKFLRDDVVYTLLDGEICRTTVTEAHVVQSQNQRALMEKSPIFQPHVVYDLLCVDGTSVRVHGSVIHRSAKSVRKAIPVRS